ncbi:RNA polymerase sigma-70 factor, ECF subfamily [Tistlia consotensis]|uniref:RNA polymerase sigma-70 factor, ECF subfamily n=1 Tax=Tistlia consotensis USBA 355 TaxID=560819 RepID=A0A1Y6B7F6_9PROT|nr:sigma-70 family RNA polymerase sigma factor [Tistlia consotensis]SME96862.1 RNA polymerase sigma-70 factor, ECF subfamily [Tistlia consotensis USBA 355]SNR56239.1 RNA polymerase sigma-70 factor, ECF subfamily [Tistlia consotensis]
MSTVATLAMQEAARFEPRDRGARAVAAGPPVTDDAGLMARVVEGDREAYRLLVERHYRGIFGLARRMGLQAAEAEDTAQDVFVRLWDKRESWQPDGAAGIKTWLYRVAVNRVIDLKRKPQALDLEQAPEPVDERQGAFDGISQAQELSQLREAIARLTEQQQLAISLFYHQELSNAEAASIMGVSVASVESLLKRARRCLREIMAEQRAGERC